MSNVVKEESPAESDETDKSAVIKAKEEPADGDSKKDDSEESAVSAVAERLRFFFSDANIRQDIFMRRLLTNDEKTVPIEVLLKFNTIKQHSTDPEVLIKAVKSDRLAGRIELTEDLKAVKRVIPFTSKLMNDNIPLTIVLENLPTKQEDNGKVVYAVTIEEINKIFEQYGEVALVKLRFGPEGTVDSGEDLGQDGTKVNTKKRRVPAGSALVEFEDEVSLKAAADDVLTRKDGATLEPKRKLEIGDKPLGAVLLKDFLAELKKRKAEETPASDSAKKKDEEEEAHEKAEDRGFHIDWKPGCVIKLKDLPPSCDREALLEAVCGGLDKSLDEVKEMKIYVDYSRGQTEGAIRFQEPTGAVEEMLKKFKAGDVEIAGVKVATATLLEGEEEKDYWKAFTEFKSKQVRQRGSQGHGRGGGRGGGGRGRGGGGYRNNKKRRRN